MEELKPLEWSDRGRVVEHLRRFPPAISEHTFTNLYVWRFHRPIRLVEVEAALLFVGLRDGRRRLFGPPVGPIGAAELLEFLRQAEVESLERLPEAAADELRRAGLRVTPDRDNADYVYLRRDLAELDGRRYHAKKNLVNQCLSSYDCEYCEVTEANLDEAAEMVERWFAEREMDQSVGLAEEYWAIRETLDNYAGLGLRGGAVRIGGRIEALTIGQALSDDTAVVHFEKAIGAYTGLYQLINQWFCRHGLTQFEYVNREQDLGIPGLRRAKKSYQPHHMVDKCAARWEA
ncbi:MAG: DUF2156 domain-containing protein [Planctomycetota bacterium]|jgi:hypothetical protein